jgi:hypothetical protein
MSPELLVPSLVKYHMVIAPMLLCVLTEHLFNLDSFKAFSCLPVVMQVLFTTTGTLDQGSNE